MPSDIKLTIVAGQDLAEKFERAGAEGRAAIRRELGQAQLDLAAAMKRNIRSNFRQRSGDLLRSIAIAPIEESGDTITGPVGSNLEYAEIQEEGGEIRAKNVRNLTIPLEPFMTGQGLARGTARDVIESPGEYGYDGTFFSRGVLMGRRGSGADAETEPLFALRPSVMLPARPYAEPAIEEVKPQFESAMRAALEALL